MDMLKKVKNMVIEGKVLDDQGAWVLLSERMATEKTIIDRLSGGKVLCEGRWIPVRQARDACGKDGVPPPQETRSLGKRRAPKGV